MRKLTVMAKLPYAAKKPHSVAGSTKKTANLFRELQMFEGIQAGTRRGLRVTMVFWVASREGPLLHVDKWNAHTLSGDRKGIWGLHVTRNRRLTFHIDMVEREICDVDLEDYH
jgi:plasmid maintenance system killer protein